jgi:hypothetical protein
MTPFEYITVLISIVLGLGITQIVSGIAEMIHHSSKIKIYWPHLLWIVLVFFLQVQEWWWLYELRNSFSWRLPVFLYVLLYPIDLFILSRILFPAFNDGPVDLKSFYFENYRKFFFLLALLALLAVIDDVFIQVYKITDEVPQLVLLIVSTIISIGKIKNEFVHKALVSIILIAVIIIALTANYL